MKKIKKVILLLLFTLYSLTSCFAQKNNKSDLYLYFKGGEKNMSKIRRDAGDNDIYDLFWYREVMIRPGVTERVIFRTLDHPDKISYQDEDFVKSKVKTIEQVSKLAGMFFDTTNEKAFPFRKVFIVEPISPNKYSVRQVVTYIGSD